MSNNENSKGLNIVCGKYLIRSDSYNMWVEKQIRVKNGKPEYTKIAGYCNNFEDLMISFMKNNIRGKDMRSVEEALKTISKAEADTKKLIRDYVKAKTSKIEEE